MKALIDTDVTIDFYTKRMPFAPDALEIWKAHRAGKFEAFVSSITPVNLFYIGRKSLGTSQLTTIIGEMVKELRVCAIDLAVLQKAHTSPIVDFEDAVQHAAAELNGVNIIVTRNIADYKNTTLTVLTPTEFLKRLP